MKKVKTIIQTNPKEQLLTKQQKEILYQLYRFRFLHTRHIQTILNHKSSSRIQAWMKLLAEKGFIEQFYNNQIIGINRVPAMYCLNTKVRTVLKDRKGCEAVILKRLYREKKLSKKFQDHCLFVTDYFLYLRTVYHNGERTLHFFTQVQLSGYDHFPHPLPDGYFAIKESSKKTQRFFVELFDEGTPRFALRKKIQRYLTCAESSDWEDQTHESFPMIIFICPTKQMQKYVQRFTQNLLDESYAQISFKVQTRDEIQ